MIGVRFSLRAGSAIVLAFCIVVQGCAGRRPVLQLMSVSPSPPPAVSVAQHPVPGTGILSHEHEERQVSRRVSRMPFARPSSVSLQTWSGIPRVRTGPKGVAPAAVPAVRAPLPSRTSRFRIPDRPEDSEGSGGVGGTARGLHVPGPTSEQWRTLAREAQEIFGLDAALVLAVVRVESDFDPTARSPAGAQGAMQIMPGTQEELGLIDPFDPRANVYAGSQYLMELLQRFRSPELALAAYNAGPGAVEKYGGIPPFEETQTFVRRVMEYWKASCPSASRP